MKTRTILHILVEVNYRKTLKHRIRIAMLEKTLFSLMIKITNPSSWCKIIFDSSRRPSQTLGNAKLIVLIRASPFALLWTIVTAHATV
jgi:hypothetical protein